MRFLHNKPVMMLGHTSHALALQQVSIVKICEKYALKLL